MRPGDPLKGITEAHLLEMAHEALRLPEPQRTETLKRIAQLAPLVRFGPPWLKTVTPDWDWEARHLLLTYKALDRITTGQCRRLAIFYPPRHGKTETVTVRYPAWWLERDPMIRIILGAYNETQALLYSRKIKRIAGARGILGTGHSASRRVDDWETVAGGGLRAVGVGGGVTGRGADLIIIDDPVKSREEAESEAYRERCWNWYKDDLWTRQEPGAAIILIMTRWHEDDLAGRIFAEMKSGGEQWEVLNLPAIAETQEDRDRWAAQHGLPPGLPDPLGRQPGEPLWPDRYDRQDLEGARQVLGRSFNALYQQRPTAAEGGLFKKEWFRYFTIEQDHYVLKIPDAPARRVPASSCWMFQTADLAGTERKQGDWTVICTWAVTPRSELLLIDVHRFQKEGPEVVLELEGRFNLFRPRFVVIEKNGIALPTVQNLIRKGYPVRGVVTRFSKVDRVGAAQGPAARYMAGTIYHLAGTTWLSDWENEHLNFPGAHDDQVDNSSLASETIVPGATVFTEFSHVMHVAPEPLPFDPRRPIICGWAFRPSIIWVATQLQEDGHWWILSTLEAEPGQGLIDFARRVADQITQEFGRPEQLEIRHAALPEYCGFSSYRSVEFRDAWRILSEGFLFPVNAPEVTLPGEHIGGRGWSLEPSMESQQGRLELLRTRLSTLIRGQPALLIDPGARLAIEAFQGGYRNKELPLGGYSSIPEDNKYRAVIEAIGCAAGLLFAAEPNNEDDTENWWLRYGIDGNRNTGRRRLITP